MPAAAEIVKLFEGALVSPAPVNVNVYVPTKSTESPLKSAWPEPLVGAVSAPLSVPEFRAMAIDVPAGSALPY